MFVKFLTFFDNIANGESIRSDTQQLLWEAYTSSIFGDHSDI